MTTEWIGAITVVVVAMAAALLAPELRRRWQRRAVARTPVAPVPEGQVPYEVFVAHAPDDLAVAEELATDLTEQHGLRVFLPKWANLPVTVRAVRCGEGILAEAHGVLVFSQNALADHELLDDYADVLKREHHRPEGRARVFVPVRTDDAALPPFAEAHAPVDLRPGDERDAELQRLVALLRA